MGHVLCERIRPFCHEQSVRKSESDTNFGVLLLILHLIFTKCLCCFHVGVIVLVVSLKRRMECFTNLRDLHHIYIPQKTFQRLTTPHENIWKVIGQNPLRAKQISSLRLEPVTAWCFLWVQPDAGVSWDTV